MGYLVQWGDGLQWARVGCNRLGWATSYERMMGYSGLGWATVGCDGLSWAPENYVHVTFMVRSKVLHVRTCSVHGHWRVPENFIVRLKDSRSSGRTILGLGTGSHSCPCDTLVVAFIPKFMVTDMHQGITVSNAMYWKVSFGANSQGTRCPAFMHGLAAFSILCSSMVRSKVLHVWTCSINILPPQKTKQELQNMLFHLTG